MASMERAPLKKFFVRTNHLFGSGKKVLLVNATMRNCALICAQLNENIWEAKFPSGTPLFRIRSFSIIKNYGDCLIGRTASDSGRSLSNIAEIWENEANSTLL